MEYTESTDMSIWLGEYARIIPHATGYFSSLSLIIPLGIDKNDDLEDGYETKKRYEELGSSAFVSYRDYLCTRLRD